MKVVLRSFRVSGPGAIALAAATLFVATGAHAQSIAQSTPADVGQPPAVGDVEETAPARPSPDQPAEPAPEAAARADATGGAYVSPTLLFIPAGAVPRWNVRVTASSELQTPSDIHAGFRPGVGGELGLPDGVTLGAGTNWVGGDINHGSGKTDFNLGLSPYFQGRLHLAGAPDGRGLQLGTSLTYKFVGFEGDPGELELAVSLQYRRERYELGLQGVFGQDFQDAGDHDAEIHAYAVYRLIPQLAVGAAGQVRLALTGEDDADPTKSKYDAIGGAIASLTIGPYQAGALAGASTLGLSQGHLGALGQLFAAARF